MGFYRIHMLEIVSIEFMIVPIIMVVGGVFAFFTAVFGLYATAKEDSCLLITHATFMMLQFFVLIAGKALKFSQQKVFLTNIYLQCLQKPKAEGPWYEIKLDFRR